MECENYLYSVGVPFYEVLKQLLCIIKIAQVVLGHSCLSYNPVAFGKLLRQCLQEANRTTNVFCLLQVDTTLSAQICFRHSLVIVRMSADYSCVKRCMPMSLGTCALGQSEEILYFCTVPCTLPSIHPGALMCVPSTTYDTM